MKRSNKAKHVQSRPRGQRRGNIGQRHAGEDARYARYVDAVRLEASGVKLSQVGIVNRLALKIRDARNLEANPRDSRAPGKP